MAGFLRIDKSAVLDEHARPAHPVAQSEAGDQTRPPLRRLLVGLPDRAGAFYCGGMNIDARMREARRKAKVEAKRERRQARRREKADAPSVGSVK